MLAQNKSVDKISEAIQAVLLDVDDDVDLALRVANEVYVECKLKNIVLWDDGELETIPWSKKVAIKLGNKPACISRWYSAKANKTFAIFIAD